jgi:hypothetical protein
MAVAGALTLVPRESKKTRDRLASEIETKMGLRTLHQMPSRSLKSAIQSWSRWRTISLRSWKIVCAPCRALPFYRSLVMQSAVDRVRLH